MSKLTKSWIWVLLFTCTAGIVFGAGAGAETAAATTNTLTISGGLSNMMKSTGISSFLFGNESLGMSSVMGWKSFLMVCLGLTMLWLGVAKDVEPVLMIPIGFGAILANTPGSNLLEMPVGEPQGFLKLVFDVGIYTEVLPILIFMGIGAMCDFAPLIANPRMALLGAAAQVGVFGTLIGVVAVSDIFGLGFDIKEACAVAIIGAADGPSSIYISGKYAPDLMGPIAVAAYSYMAMVPLIQPPIMRALTTKKERLIKMSVNRDVSQKEKMFFPLLVLALCVLLFPSALPLMGSFCFGNFIRECGATERLSKALQNEIANIATILLGLGVGRKMVASEFLEPRTLAILSLGLVAFMVGTAGGVMFAKIMNWCSPKNPVNPLIGSAGLSAFPMAARVSHKLGQEEDPSNFLIFQAMGANVAGQIGSIAAAGVILALLG